MVWCVKGEKEWNRREEKGRKGRGGMVCRSEGGKEG